MTTSAPRNAEKWARGCRFAGHQREFDAERPLDRLCLDCAHAYARKVGEAVREEAVRTVQQTPNGMYYGPGVEDLTIGMVETAVDDLKQTLAAAIRQIEVKTP